MIKVIAQLQLAYQNLANQKIEIENNSIIQKADIKKKLSFLYKENLFFLDVRCHLLALPLPLNVL